MGGACSFSLGRADAISSIYQNSILLQLVKEATQDSIVRHAQMHKLEGDKSIRRQNGAMLFIYDGCIDLYLGNSKAIRLRVASENGSSRFVKMMSVTRSDQSKMYPNSYCDTAESILSTEILLVFKPDKILCRYSCQTRGEEIILKSAHADRVVVIRPVCYLRIKLKSNNEPCLSAITSGEVQELVGNIPFFSSIPTEKLSILTELSTIRVYPPSMVIVQEGEAFSHQMYLTLAGRLKASNSKAKAPLATLTPGSFFGEMSLLINTPRTATITSLESCMLLTIEKKAFHVFLEYVPEVKASIYAVLRERLVIKALRSGILLFLADIPEDGIKQLSQKMELLDKFRIGDCVLDHNSVNEVGFMLVINGSLEIIRTGRKAFGYRRNKSVLLGPGCYFGQFTFDRLQLGQDGSIVACTAAVVLSCPKDVLNELFRVYPVAYATAKIAWDGTKCDLESVFAQPKLKQAFCRFVKDEHSDENFRFCEGVEEYRSIDDDDAKDAIGLRKHAADVLVSQYIKEGSESEVNLPDWIRKRLLYDVQNSSVPSVHVFDEACTEILKLMTRDALPRFQKTSAFEHVLEKLSNDMYRQALEDHALEAFHDTLAPADKERVESLTIDRLSSVLGFIAKKNNPMYAMDPRKLMAFQPSKVQLEG